ncbi:MULTISPECIES: hypothetical protein [unclassified Micromonospora]|uniref:hypothetical protein n=1 Tax=unclassified Micromonospora TaxID=2617518 RepID=UPI003624F8C8
MRSTLLRAALVAAAVTASLASAGCSRGVPGTPVSAPSGTTVGSIPATTGPTPATNTPATTGPAQATGTLAPAAAARVVVRRSGGYGGLDDTVTVEPDGRWTAVDRAGTRRAGRLTGADLDRLRQLAAAPRLAEGGTADSDGRCADAFSYRLDVGGATVDWTDCPVAGTPPQAASALAEFVLTAAR